MVRITPIPTSALNRPAGRKRIERPPSADQRACHRGRGFWPSDEAVDDVDGYAEHIRQVFQSVLNSHQAVRRQAHYLISRTGCSPPTPTSSTIAAWRGTSSSGGPGRSCPSASGTGPMGSDQRKLVLGCVDEGFPIARILIQPAGWGGQKWESLILSSFAWRRLSVRVWTIGSHPPAPCLLLPCCFY